MWLIYTADVKSVLQANGNLSTGAREKEILEPFSPAVHFQFKAA
jgi:hypothetical protein